MSGTLIIVIVAVAFLGLVLVPFLWGSLTTVTYEFLRAYETVVNRFRPEPAHLRAYHEMADDVESLGENTGYLTILWPFIVVWGFIHLTVMLSYSLGARLIRSERE